MGGVAGVADDWKRHICFAVGDKEGVAGGGGTVAGKRLRT